MVEFRGGQDFRDYGSVRIWQRGRRVVSGGRFKDRDFRRGRSRGNNDWVVRRAQGRVRGKIGRKRGGRMVREVVGLCGGRDVEFSMIGVEDFRVVFGVKDVSVVWVE